MACLSKIIYIKFYVGVASIHVSNEPFVVTQSIVIKSISKNGFNMDL